MSKAGCGKAKFLCDWIAKLHLFSIVVRVLPILVVALPLLLLHIDIDWPIRPACEHCESSPRLYEWISLGFAILATILIIIWLVCEDFRNEQLSKMRHAIAILVLIGLAVASWSTYTWGWLNIGDESNSATIRNIGIAVATVLTLIFVIWRERIASERSGTAKKELNLARFQRGTDMLSSKSEAVRIGGIALLRMLGQENEFRETCLHVLLSVRSNSTGDEGKAAKHAIEALADQSIAQNKEDR